MATMALVGGLSGCGSGLADLSTATEAAAPTQTFMEVGDPPVRLAVNDVGEGRPVVLIHGLGTNSYTWHEVAPALAEQYRVVTIDLKGFGASEKPLEGPYTVRAQADLVQEVIDRKGLRDATLVGHSYGGGVSLLLALDDAKAPRQRISRLVLLDSIAYPQDTPLFFDLLQVPVIGDLSMSVIPADVQIEQALRLAYEQEHAITEEAIARYSAPLATAGGKHAVVETIRHIVPEDIETIARQYPNVTAPTLIVWCDRDRVVPIEMGRRLAANMPNAAMRIVRGCGHAPQEEKPAETLEVIKAHLRGAYDAQLGVQTN
ncbi:pimeloyl-ACP methyl ester carboxylesterase [Dichotomicrobium thermohalophilum]|uniref:Pimeloyl-ACP methyl ester carboxylesterase n=2 Tax=Dichotomicrobium thermohalophilum TaxID=933063 RepID=A0A397PE18_9HYPH|nr:pimeloyl-ACP methyl ester carboxylesterase [Dichotomicrobium thermohalophilum]